MDAAIYNAALSVPCTFCGAQPEHSCWSVQGRFPGKPVPYLHGARTREARAAFNAGYRCAIIHAEKYGLERVARWGAFG